MKEFLEKLSKLLNDYSAFIASNCDSSIHNTINISIFNYDEVDFKEIDIDRRVLNDSAINVILKGLD